MSNCKYCGYKLNHNDSCDNCAMEPTWTSDVPTDSGWYWCRDSERPTTTKEVCWIDCEDYAQVPGEEFWTEQVEEPPND